MDQAVLPEPFLYLFWVRANPLCALAGLLPDLLGLLPKPPPERFPVFSLTVTILSAGMSRSYVDQFRSRKSPTSTLTSAAWRMDKSPRSLSRTAGGRLLTRVAARRAHAESSPAGARLGDGSIDHDCADHPELGRRLRGVHVVSAEAHILVERHAVAAGTLAIRP